ncbi:lipoyl(octanoyl) transferase [Malassezia cuniculi]|uniref:lipoyl(octanoyl) transferase n=1 Tax=Malassezia cuniculi TaxID=948313 RepID=A0AAF0EQL0_9BASI|nr:lipoyl(octanoyl) transferase [Malassezia cuniculi]
MASPIQVAHIPYRVPYALGLKLQEHLVAQRIAARAVVREHKGASPTQLSANAQAIDDAKRVADTDFLLLLEHTPVYTQGKRQDTEADNVAAAPGRTADFFKIPRGGLLTYHGPGQLVGYPILDLGAMNMSVRCYVSKLQDAIRDTLAQLDIPTVGAPSEEARYTGVWVDPTHKIASLGVHVQHRIVSHGFALNVQDEALEGFRRIVACGLREVQMTCVNEHLRKLGIDAAYDVAQVSRLAAGHISARLDRDTQPVSSELLSWEADAHSILAHFGGAYGF